MDRHDGIPHVVIDLEHRLVPKDAGVVDQDVHLAPLVRGRGDDGVSLGDHVVVVGDGFAPGLVDLLGDRVGHGGASFASVAVSTQVVHHDPGALPGKKQGVFAAEAAAGPRDDGDFSVEHSHG